MSVVDKDKRRLAVNAIAKRVKDVIPGTLRTGGQLDNTSSVLSPRLPTNPMSSNRFKRSGLLCN
ncbi:hypothetical protein EON65_02730 [archaeon]|nr:MAG: hypothetical protein EON65_02730 [archaeon]